MTFINSEWFAIISVPVFENEELELDDFLTFSKKILNVIPTMGLLGINGGRVVQGEGTKRYNEIKLLYSLAGYDLYAFEAHIMLQIATVVGELEDVEYEITKDEDTPQKFYHFELN